METTCSERPRSVCMPWAEAFDQADACFGKSECASACQWGVVNGAVKVGTRDRDTECACVETTWLLRSMALERHQDQLANVRIERAVRVMRDGVRCGARHRHVVCCCIYLLVLRTRREHATWRYVPGTCTVGSQGKCQGGHYSLQL